MNIDYNNLVTAGVGLAGTLIGSLLTYISTRREQKLTDMKEHGAHLARELGRAADQVRAYHALEAEYAEDIARDRNAAPRTIKTEYRNRVEERGYVRPTWTAGDARGADELAGNTAQEQ
jgi:hypothetical protein